MEQPYFVNVENIKAPREWDAVPPAEYILDHYDIDVEKEEDGTVILKIKGVDADGKKRATAFQVTKGIPYAVTVTHIRAAFQAMFRLECQKVLAKQDEGQS